MVTHPHVLAAVNQELLAGLSQIVTAVITAAGVALVGLSQWAAARKKEEARGGDKGPGGGDGEGLRDGFRRCCRRLGLYKTAYKDALERLRLHEERERELLREIDHLRRHERDRDRDNHEP